MSLDPHPQHEAPCAPDAAGRPDDPNYWFQLLNEKEAGEFLSLTARAMQKWRQIGGGARYVWLSSRCLRYRRIDLHEWAESRIRTSTSDPGTAK